MMPSPKAGRDSFRRQNHGTVVMLTRCFCNRFALGAGVGDGDAAVPTHTYERQQQTTFGHI